MNKCDVCSKDLTDILITVDAKRICFEDLWDEQFNNNKYKFYFSEENYTTCLNCFKDLSIWKNNSFSAKNKINFLRNRTLGIKNKTIFPIKLKYDKCYKCKKKTEYPTTKSIYSRECYIEGLGQFCKKCYHEITNDRIIIKQFNLEYLL